MKKLSIFNTHHIISHLKQNFIQIYILSFFLVAFLFISNSIPIAGFLFASIFTSTSISYFFERCSKKQMIFKEYIPKLPALITIGIFFAPTYIILGSSYLVISHSLTSAYLFLQIFQGLLGCFFVLSNILSIYKSICGSQGAMESITNAFVLLKKNLGATFILMLELFFVFELTISVSPAIAIIFIPVILIQILLLE